MYCIKCGYKIADSAKYCTKCGHKQSEPVSSNKSSSSELYRLVNSSRQFFKGLSGYYCLNCGKYVSKYDKTGRAITRCQGCNTPVIAADYINKFFTFDIGDIVVAGINAVNGTTQSSKDDVLARYYKSEYYKITSVPAEILTQDKGRVGEYLVSIQFGRLKEKQKERSLHAYYNVFVP